MCITLFYLIIIAGYDYTEFAANMSLNPGDMLICQTFDVILDDSFLEEPETFTVSVFQIGIRPKATFTQAHNKITIVDDESKIYLYTLFLACIYTVSVPFTEH